MTKTGSGAGDTGEAGSNDAGTGDTSYVLHPVGRVESPLTDLDLAPCQGDEGAPDAWLMLDPDMAAAMTGLDEGSEIIVLTWLDRASREVYQVHPRGDLSRPLQGVFNTRSPDRPNPIGLHTVLITGIRGTRIGVRNLEAIDGTPILDIKPVLGAVSAR
jgi:tRNA-Thr(GGU) m(6)t(6)A37 methyltransferase TsaA